MKSGLYILEDGSKSWYTNNSFHRVDGPAREWTDGTKMWYLNGQLVYFKSYNITINNINEFNNLSEEFKLSIIKYELTK
jgi:hypothetical protein